MTMSMFLLLARGALVLAAALVLARALQRSSAAIRSSVLAAGLVAIAALPLLHSLAPTAVTTRVSSAARDIVAPPTMPVAEPSPSPMAAPTIVPDSAPVAPARSFPWATLALSLWLAGIVALVARASIGAIRARRIAMRGTPVRALVPAILAAWRSLGGRVDPPRVVASDEITAPIVVGAIAPIIVVPVASREWTAERWRVVLLHELAHVHRRDGLTNLIAQLACALHWPNPLAWIAARQLRMEREHAADDAVLRTGTRASSYAEHLMEIAVGVSAPMAALAMAEPSRFEQRVTALLDDSRSRRPAGRHAAIAITATLGVVAAISACMSPDAAPLTPVQQSSTCGATNDAIQATATAELERAIAEFRGTSAVAIVLDAKTGALVAHATLGDLDETTPRNNGSTLKPFTIAAALEAGIATPETKLDCEQGQRAYGAKVLKDSAPHGVLDLGAILAVSSNVCVAKLAAPLGDRLGTELRRYHLPAPQHIDTASFEGAAIATGVRLEISSLALASAYTAFANDGVYRGVDGRSERVMSVETARAVTAMLDRVVNDPDGTGRGARLPTARVLGKTGTASSAQDNRHYASFVGLVPADAPRFVILVGVDGVESYGGKVAAPVFAKIAATALAQ